MKFWLSLLFILSLSILYSQEKIIQTFPDVILDIRKSTYTNFIIEGPSIDKLKGQNIIFKMSITRISGETPLNFEFKCYKKDTSQRWGHRLFSDENLKTPQTKIAKKNDYSVVLSVPSTDNLSDIKFQIYYTKSLAKDDVFKITNPRFILPLTQKLKKNSSSVSETLPDRFETFLLTLVKNEKLNFKIVIPEKANLIASTAAQEIQTHIKLATGQAPDIIQDSTNYAGNSIQIGDTILAQKFAFSPSSFPPDSYMIRRIGKHIFISGGDYSKGTIENFQAKGTLYAAYEFLERYWGVRWYWPGELGIVVHHVKNLIIKKINIAGIPSYSCRYYFYPYPSQKEFTVDEMNKWYRRLRVGMVGGTPIGMHSFNHWADKYSKTHPEYFALQQDGVRSFKKSGAARTHVCFSNPGVLKQTIKEKIEFFRNNPDAKFSSVMPGDSSGLFSCCCSECSKKLKGSSLSSFQQSNLVWGFVNKVAQEVAKVFPDRKITCCAYGYYSMPPDFPLNSNVAVTLCAGRPPTGNLQFKKRYEEFLKKWQATGAEIYLWNYWDVVRRKAGAYAAPTICPRQLKEAWMIDRGIAKGRIIELANHDADGVFYPEWKYWLFDVVNVYVASHLMWNSDYDVDLMLDDFFKSFYGPAAKPMRKFYDAMEKQWVNSDFIPKLYPNDYTNWNWQTCWQQTYPPEFVSSMMNLLREAVKASQKQEPYYQRTQKTLEGFLPFERNSQKYSGKRQKGNPKKIAIPFTTSAPLIDGKIDEPGWNSAIQINNFYDRFQTKKTESATTVKIMHDLKNIYFAVTAEYPHNHKIKWVPPQAGSRDSDLWNYESIEIFFAKDEKNYIQFIISPDNKLLDSKKTNNSSGIKWNSKAVLATLKCSNKWTMEMAIPLKDLQMDTQNPNQWKFNIYRNHFYKTDEKTHRYEAGCWQSPGEETFHNIKNFGNIQLNVSK